MDISKLDKARVLKALYNRAQPLGMGFLQYTPKPMTEDEANVYITCYGAGYIDYLQGRVMKIDLAEDNLRTDLYNRDNGEKAAELAILEEFAEKK